VQHTRADKVLLIRVNTVQDTPPKALNRIPDEFMIDLTLSAPSFQAKHALGFAWRTANLLPTLEEIF
jgi:hypothetical protein